MGIHDCMNGLNLEKIPLFIVFLVRFEYDKKGVASGNLRLRTEPARRGGFIREPKVINPSLLQSGWLLFFSATYN